VGSTAAFTLLEAQEQIDARLMKLVIGVKRSNKDGGVEEGFHR
jgi:hypothetical protein